jgi:type VI secretion system secreted protein VgrG
MASPLLSQHARLINIETALGSDLPDSLVVDSFVGYEAVNAPFNFEILALSPSVNLDLSPFIGEEITLRLLTADGSKRSWHGYCTQASWLGADGGMARYHLKLSSFLSFLALRRDAYIFQDKNVQQIVTDILAEYPQANFSWDSTQTLKTYPIQTQYRESDYDFLTRILAAEGLSWRFEHEQNDALTDATSAAQADSDAPMHAKHKLIIFDAQTEKQDIKGGSVRYHGVRATESKDSIHQFSGLSQVQSNAVSLASWHAAQVQAPAAEIASSKTVGTLPDLPVYQTLSERTFDQENEASQFAQHQLDAHTLGNHTYMGAGGARDLEAGYAFTLSQHDIYPAGQNRFTLLAVSHYATNNFNHQVEASHEAASKEFAAMFVPDSIDINELARGTYRNQFSCVQDDVMITPPLAAKQKRPIAHGPQNAIVVGLDNATITTERDHRIKVQFPWQRGAAPLAGGLNETGNPVDTEGNAPHNEQSGTWVRVSESLAGPNWGSHFTPRIGTEVLVDFIEGDMNKPIVVAALYNGSDLPPYNAGVDSGVNHAGVVSGTHTQSLNGDGYNQWILDDTQSQLRMRLSTSTADTQLNMGYLIQQSPYDANRGRYRGTGLELRTDAWGVLRGQEGVLFSTTARPYLGSSPTSTQMDVNESVMQLKGAEQLTEALSQSAVQQTALYSSAANDAQIDRISQLDVDQQGQYTGAVNGQTAKKAKPGERTLDKPVERFASPLLHMDSASSMHWASPASTLLYAGQQLHWTTQQDSHWAAGHTFASVSGEATSYYTHSGGIQAIAANGPVSVQAHTDAMEILADQAVTVTASEGHIQINASKEITLQAGQSAIALEGGNITFACPGTFSVKAGKHAFKGPASQAAKMTGLPDTRVKVFDEAFVIYDEQTGEPITFHPYRVKRADGTYEYGTTDEKGYTHISMTADIESLDIEILER